MNRKSVSLIALCLLASAGGIVLLNQKNDSQKQEVLGALMKLAREKVEHEADTPNTCGGLPTHQATDSA